MSNDDKLVQSVLTRNWFSMPGASEGEIQRLVGALPFNLPRSYIALLRATNGGEGPLDLFPCNLCLYDIEYALSFWNEADVRADYPDMYFFGGNGSLEWFAIRFVNSSPREIVAIDPCAGLESCERLADGFDEFLAHVGLERPTAPAPRRKRPKRKRRA